MLGVNITDLVKNPFFPEIRGKVCRVFASGLFWILLLVCSAGAADYGYIDINNPFLRKIPIATPYFKADTGQPAEREMAVRACDILSETIDFTGYFKILDRGGYLVSPENPAVVGSEINFQNWTTIGAELLVTGLVRIQAETVEMELRLFDTLQGRLIVGKRYKGRIEDERRIIRRFCSEVIHSLTGDWGIFNSRIAFVSNGTGNKEIYFCDFDGHNPKKFTSHGTITLSPAWSSDGRWLAYTSYLKGKPDLYIRNIKEKRGVVVAREGINTDPAWVPGQFALAATLSYSGDPEIYLLTGEGKIIKRITNNFGIDGAASWSPDGRKAAFVSNRSGSPQIYIKDLQNNTERRLTFQGNYNTQPSWSPRGDKIAYSAMEKGEINIFVIDAMGGDPVPLTREAGMNEKPVWSPDGSLIAFSSTREGPSRIFVMTAYGTDQRRLIVLPGEQSSPSWSPRLAHN